MLHMVMVVFSLQRRHRFSGVPMTATRFSLSHLSLPIITPWMTRIRACPSALGTRKKGGYRACTFVSGLGAFKNMGSVANMFSMVLYFKYVMEFDISTSSNTLANIMGSVCLLSLLGDFISDKLHKLYTILIFGSLEVIVCFCIN